MKATVIGCGRWGSFIAWYLRKIGHEVTLYGREGSRHIEQFCQTRTNGLDVGRRCTHYDEFARGA